jgi:diaminopimelate epimerase
MRFTKMQATGNDFILVESANLKHNWNNLAQKMCHRHFGVGADGLILVDSSQKPVFMRIFNADGSEAEICGNGLRCFSKYVCDNGLISDYNIEINTPSGIKESTIFLENGKVSQVKVNMGTPKFSAVEIPVKIDNGEMYMKGEDINLIMDYPLNVSGEKLALNFVNMGNPHSVNFISTDVSFYPLNAIGPLVENHVMFPERTNFEIANIIDRRNIKARVWERGVGETLACGSGACAIAVSASVKNLIEKQVDIMMLGGKLTIEWEKGRDVYLTGAAETVFTGEWLG